MNRKKPVVVEAIQYHKAETNRVEIMNFISAKHYREGAKGIGVETLEGFTMINPGDWVIRGIKGKFYPVKNDIFEQTYEPA